MNPQMQSVPLNSFDFSMSDKSCHIRIFRADMTQSDIAYDVAVCSAFKGDYTPVTSTLIGSLLANRGISVKDLSQSPGIDLRTQGSWLSATLEGPISRIACLELLDWDNFIGMIQSEIEESQITTILKSSFLTLRHLLETADNNGITIRRIALPILGAGNQGINTEYIAVPLFHQCRTMFQTIPTLTTIDFYELNPDRAARLNDIIVSLMPQEKQNSREVFISYSSKQSSRAHALQDTLAQNGFSVWIAPEGIPTGSNYLTEIPTAISNAQAVVLMLTPEAMHSAWVRREASCAVGAGIPLIPAQLSSFDLNQEYAFLLDGVQILPAWSYPEERQDVVILDRVREKMKP